MCEFIPWRKLKNIKSIKDIFLIFSVTFYISFHISSSYIPKIDSQHIIVFRTNWNDRHCCRCWRHYSRCCHGGQCMNYIAASQNPPKFAKSWENSQQANSSDSRTPLSFSLDFFPNFVEVPCFFLLCCWRETKLANSSKHTVHIVLSFVSLGAWCSAMW